MNATAMTIFMLVGLGQSFILSVRSKTMLEALGWSICATGYIFGIIGIF